MLQSLKHVPTAHSSCTRVPAYAQSAETWIELLNPGGPEAQKFETPKALKPLTRDVKQKEPLNNRECAKLEIATFHHKKRTSMATSTPEA